MLFASDDASHATAMIAVIVPSVLVMFETEMPDGALSLRSPRHR